MLGLRIAVLCDEWLVGYSLVCGVTRKRTLALGEGEPTAGQSKVTFLGCVAVSSQQTLFLPRLFPS